MQLDINTKSRQTTKLNRIVVIGGGVTGLSAARRLVELNLQKKLNLEVSVLESSGKTGGVISTRVKDGFIIEDGPDSFLTTKPWALDLSLRAGLESSFTQAIDEVRNIFIMHGGRLIPVPEGFLLAPTRLMPFIASPLFSWSGKLRMSLDIVLPRRKSQEDESIQSFITRRLGREAHDIAVQPLISGIYAGDPRTLSIRSTLPHIVQMEEKHGSLIRAMRKAAKLRESKNKNTKPRYSQFLSFKKGMQQLVDVLASDLPKGSIRLNKFVKEITMTKNGWRIAANDNEFVDAGGIIIAIPTHRAALLVNTFDSVLAGKLSKIQYSSSVTVNLAYNREDVSHPLNGFGFVVPASQGLPILACSFSSVKFAGRAPKETVLLRCFMGGAIDPGICEMDESELANIAHNIISGILGIKSNPLLKTVSRNPKSMPQYTVGHSEHIAQINSITDKFPSLQLAGNAYNGVGIPDCVRSGEEAAEKLFKHIERSSNRA